ncbi:hypothetical protein [Bacillus sp. 179-C3.3 HS]|uniref:hypothetical protein n=1 Tax=Bacillus sp. 179-C3.3 HS TaxID=3232162 RepID=UPI0039A19D49
MNQKKERRSPKKNQSMLYFITDAFIPIVDLFFVALRTVFYLLRKVISGVL